MSAARASDANVEDAYSLVQKISDMGEPLYAKEAPTGYKDNAEAWLSTAGADGAHGFRGRAGDWKDARRAIDWARFQGKDPAAIVRELLGREPSAQTIDGIGKGIWSEAAAARDGGGAWRSLPDFQRR